MTNLENELSMNELDFVVAGVRIDPGYGVGNSDSKFHRLENAIVDVVNSVVKTVGSVLGGLFPH